MFYPVESLRRGGRFYLCWVADSWPLRFATITQRQLWSQDVRDICDDLMQVMNRESGYASARFSLRLSSQLMRGLVRLYQRKVVTFLGDLCMMNATVIKHTNKKWGPHHSPQKRETWSHPRTPRRAVVEEIPEVEERVEERIQESGNAVANIEQITLKEAAIPEIQVPTDGFGEENPEQAFQLLNDRTLEQMLGQTDGSVVQNSGLELPMLDVEKSLDKSRLYPHDALQMDRISDMDITMFRKSTADDLMQMDLEKDIPPIPDIPIPGLSVLPPEKEVVSKEGEKAKTPEKPAEASAPAENEKEPQVELELEELEAESGEPKRKRPRRLIIDKKIKTNSNVFRQRLENINVEMRCEDSSDDIIDALFLPAEYYLRRPACVGWRVHDRLGWTLHGMFVRNLTYAAHQTDDKDIETMLGGNRKTRPSRAKTLQEDAPKTPPVPAVSTDKLSIIPEENPADTTGARVSAVEQLDIADMPTQVLSQDVPRKRSCDVEELGDCTGAKKPCNRSGYISFKETQEEAEQVIIEEQQTLEKSKERLIGDTTRKSQRRERKSKETSELVPQHEQIPQMELEVPEIPQMNDQDRETHVSNLLHLAGLADATNVPQTDVLLRNTSQNKVGEEGSETPLGSLDRTRVDLGESVRTTDTQRFLRTEWGTQGTMLKTIKFLHKGCQPLTVKVLVKNGPVLDNMEKIIAARCFTALLKLKQHGFIKLEKDVTTLEVTNIQCGPRIQM